MPSGHELASDLRSDLLPRRERAEKVKQFGLVTGWRPNYEIDYPQTKAIASGHLLVEHGLQPLVAITFLRNNYTFSRLGSDERSLLLSISYNNLVDWHYFPDIEGIWVANNRTDPMKSWHVSVSDNPKAWMAEEFDKLAGRQPNPNLPALDDALIDTISFWKRELAGELKNADLTEPISELFNAIFFVRAIEDYRRKQSPNTQRALLDASDRKPPRTIHDILAAAIDTVKPITARKPAKLWDEDSLRLFDNLGSHTVRSLLGDFYDNKFAPYVYDFSLISKYALSRIYEHYISGLRVTATNSPGLFTEPAEEILSRQMGSHYTPHYIASFFARFLANEYAGTSFAELKTADPACGSGIFLRTLLEMQCDPRPGVETPVLAKKAFANVLGIDIQRNAAKAAKLSLSLLYLIATGEFPKNDLEIVNHEAIEYVTGHPELAATFDAVLANPPFVKWERIPQALQSKLASYLTGYETTKPDLYFAFIKAGLEMVKPGGFMLYVLPHSFLLSDNAQYLREKLFASCWVRFLCDLSEIDVFDEASPYTILLIVQKKPAKTQPEPVAFVVRCTAYPGHALELALENRAAENGHYCIYPTDQSTFQSPTWQVLSPAERRLQDRILRFPKLEAFALVKQGFITGCDPVFIRKKTDVPTKEGDAYIPYLSDREMRRFQVPSETPAVVFYPFDGERVLTEADIQNRYPETWKYLEENEAVLKARKSLNRVGQGLWWRPLWPRPPKHLLRPKVVSPHLMLFPRFSLDSEGKFGVSHSAMLFSKDEANDLHVLRYALAVLNSPIGHWQIIHQSHRYDRSYARPEVSTLKKFCLPSPSSVSPTRMNMLQDLVGVLIANPTDTATDEKLGDLVAAIYGVDPQDLEIATPEGWRRDRSEGIEKQFVELAARWKEETRFASKMKTISEHPAYRKIVAMGDKAVPLILADLEKTGDSWFMALREITGADPVPKENRGKMKETAYAWISWGHARGYRWKRVV